MTVRDLLLAALDEALGGLMAAGLDGPERAYISHGEPAADCSQMTVHLVRMRPKLLEPRSGDFQSGCAMSWVAVLAIVYYACFPAVDDHGAAPSPDDLHAAGAQMAIYGETVARRFSRRWAEKAWPPDGRCNDVVWGNLEPIAPSGGLAGWRLTMDVQL